MRKSMKNDNPKTIKTNYKKVWEKDYLLKGWIQNDPDNSDKVFCRYCSCLLYAHRFSILKHASTRKHQKNVNLQEEKKTKVENLRFDFELDISGNLENPTSKLCREVEETNAENLQTERSLDENEDIIEYLESDFEEQPEVLENPQEKMSVHKTPTISTHILDTSLGKAAANVPITLFKMDNNNWKQISQSATNNDGRCAELISSEEFTAGCYKLRFDTCEYFRQTSRKFLYPFVEIVFECEPNQHYHIPLLLNPFGYSTYRGT